MIHGGDGAPAGKPWQALKERLDRVTSPAVPRPYHVRKAQSHVEEEPRIALMSHRGQVRQLWTGLHLAVPDRFIQELMGPRLWSSGEGKAPQLGCAEVRDEQILVGMVALDQCGLLPRAQGRITCR